MDVQDCVGAVRDRAFVVSYLGDDESLAPTDTRRSDVVSRMPSSSTRSMAPVTSARIKSSIEHAKASGTASFQESWKIQKWKSVSLKDDTPTVKNRVSKLVHENSDIAGFDLDEPEIDLSGTWETTRGDKLTIDGNTIAFHDNTSASISQCADGHFFAMVLGGKTYTAKFSEGQLAWDDCELWTQLEKQFVFLPPMPGLTIDWRRGSVAAVHKGGQAESLGVEEGLKIISINGQPFSRSSEKQYESAVARSQGIRMVLNSPASMDIKPQFSVDRLMQKLSQQTWFCGRVDHMFDQNKTGFYFECGDNISPGDWLRISPMYPSGTQRKDFHQAQQFVRVLSIAQGIGISTKVLTTHVKPHWDDLQRCVVSKDSTRQATIEDFESIVLDERLPSVVSKAFIVATKPYKKMLPPLWMKESRLMGYMLPMRVTDAEKCLNFEALKASGEGVKDINFFAPPLARDQSRDRLYYYEVEFMKINETDKIADFSNSFPRVGWRLCHKGQKQAEGCLGDDKFGWGLCKGEPEKDFQVGDEVQVNKPWRKAKVVALQQGMFMVRNLKERRLKDGSLEDKFGPGDQVRFSGADMTRYNSQEVYRGHRGVVINMNGAVVRVELDGIGEVRMNWDQLKLVCRAEDIDQQAGIHEISAYYTTEASLSDMRHAGKLGYGHDVEIWDSREHVWQLARICAPPEKSKGEPALKVHADEWCVLHIGNPEWVPDENGGKKIRMGTFVDRNDVEIGVVDGETTSNRSRGDAHVEWIPAKRLDETVGAPKQRGSASVESRRCVRYSVVKQDSCRSKKTPESCVPGTKVLLNSEDGQRLVELGPMLRGEYKVEFTEGNWFQPLTDNYVGNDRLRPL